jgi:dihydroxyacid dehydratase/phosphogluconate dehydratase
MDVLRRGLRPSDILTREAFENAIAGVAASGGSTNSVLHLIALARELGIPLTVDDFDSISRRTPLFCDLMPGGRYAAADLDKAGGTRLVAQRLVEAGLVHNDAMTVTGRTFAEEASLAEETPGQDVVRSAADPIKESGGLVILKGNIAPEGAVVKLFGYERTQHRGPGPRLQLRALRPRRRPPQPGQGGGRRRHPLRRAEGRPRHAGDARRDGDDRRPGPRRLPSPSSPTAASAAPPRA